ncbi:MAG TPA: branched-chain amino acid ABC transporter substrate-binding protein [Gaiellaceae bacterium]|jgi:branched-chain amino acid transport system substrate-binding protein|nr:branched-chain amino acid ABC transporter substrate-binding protein [Gaiellaceae bacterium]
MKKALGLVPVAAAAALAPVALGTGASTDSAVRPAAAGSALLKCGKTRTIGVAAPITGPAASLGQQQLKWARFFVSRYNASHKNKLRVVPGDTQLPDTAQAIQVAERFASNSKILGVVGPAGSQEVQVSTAPLRNGGLGFISGSATRTTLTTDGTRKGFFFRTVPNDDVQGARVANYIRQNLRASRVVVVDAQNSYSVGLSDTVERLLKAANLNVRRESVSEATVTDFSSLAARIPADTQVVYVPWQIAPKAQLFGQQLRAAGKQATLFGSDGLYDPDNFKLPGSYVSAFPVDFRNRVVTLYRRGPGGGQSDLFGLPSYVAADVVARAIDKACANGTATRAEVRRFVSRTNIPKSQSLLGFQVRYVQQVKVPLGPGDMERPADYILYRINAQGVYVRIG